MNLWVGMTNKRYNLDIADERFRLREDLGKEGFFLVTENKRYYEMFDHPHISRNDLAELLNSMKLFEVSVQKVPMTKN